MKKYSKSVFNQKARKLLLKGAGEVYKALSTTLGPRGRNIVLWQFHQTRVQHDGYTICRYVNPKGYYENAGATIIKQAAQRQVDVVGDGTTVTVVLAMQIAREAEKIVESGVNPMALRQGLEKGCELLVSEITNLAKKVSTLKEKIEVATIAAEDEFLGRIIAETLHKTGLDGVLTAEKATGMETFIEHQEGMQVESGYKSPYFITNPQTMTATVTEGMVMVTDYVLNDIYNLMPLLEELTKTTHNLVIFCNDMEGSAFATILQNKMEGKLNALVVKIPSFHQVENLQDIATILGAKFVSKDAGHELKKVTPDWLGMAEKITSSREATTIIGGAGTKKAIKERIDSIKNQIKEEESDFEKEKLRERMAKLTGGVYTVRVGGHTEIEIDEKLERAKDAVLATKAAIQEGIVPGGEIIYLPITKVLDKPKDDNEEYAFRILKNALEKPFNKLVTNAGLDAGRILASLERKEFGWGMDVTDGKLKKLSEVGIIDPAKVAKEAIRNAVSVAVQIITSNGVVAEIVEEGK